MGKKDIEKHQIKTGQILNPKGRPISGVKMFIAELANAGYTRITKAELEQLYSCLVDNTEDELKELAVDKTKSMIIRIVAKQILGKDGFHTIETMLNRIHGKPAQQQPDAPTGENVTNFTEDRNEPPIL